MESTALVLACHPPFEGPWVPIPEGVELQVDVSSRPAANSNGVVVEVVDAEGVVTQHPPGGKLHGVKARALIDGEEGTELISVYLGVEDDDDRLNAR